MTSFKREDYTEDEQRLLDAEGFFDDEDNSPPEEVIVGTEELPSLSVRKKARTSHVESEEYTKELDLEAEHKLKVKDQEYETGRIANDPSEGLLGAFKRKLIDPAYWESTLQNLNEPTRMTGSAVVGIAKGAEEIAQTLGAPDNALNLPKPKDTGEGLIQGVGQQLPTFLGALKGLNYVDKYTDVLKGRSTLKSALAGAITDFTTLDPKDPTVVDLLFVFDIISKDSTLGALLKETLGQNDKDSEGYARSKQALLGLLFGGMIDLTIQGSKAAKNAVVNRKEAKEFNKPIALEAKTDPPPPPPPASPSVKADDPIVSQAKEQIEKEKLEPKPEVDEISPELKEDTKKVIDGFSEFVDEVHATGSPEQKAKLEEALPGMKAAQKERKNKEAGEGVQDDHIWENLDETKKQEIVDMVIRFSKKQDLLQEVNLNEINSMNFNKLLEGDDVKNVLQGISEKADIADLVKTKIATEDFDTVSGIKKLQELTGLGEGQAGKILQEQANNVRNAIKFVAVARVMGVATLKQADAAFERFAATSNKADYNRALQFTRLTTEMLGAGGELSKASSDLLRAHKKLIDNADHLSEYKAFLTKELEVDPVIAVTTAKRMGIKNTIDKLQVETKSKLTGKRKHTRASVTKQIENRIKSLEKQLEADPNAPKKPKKAPVTSKRIRELEGQLKVKKAKLKAAKKELKNKTKLSKEQNAIRKEFESLSKKIREAKNRKAKTPKQQKLKTVDISKLKAELKRVRAKYKAEVPESYKTQKEIEKLSKEYNELLLIRDPDKAPKPKEKGTPRVRTERELNLIEKIRRQKFRLNMLKGDNLKKDDLIGIIKREDLETSVDILQNESLKQLKGRVNYLTKSAVARTKDAALQIYINGLLSTLKTFAVNGVGNSSAIVFNMAETFYAGATAGGVVTTREARELASGYMEQLSSLSDLWSLFKKGMDIEGSGAVKTDYGRVYDSAITKENWGQYGVLGQGLDFAANIVDFPKRLMLASDEVFKGVTYGAEKRRLSWRKAWQEADGDLDAAEELYKDILSDFEAHPDLVELADISKAKNTYTNKLPSYLSQDTFGNPTVKKGLALTIKDALDLDPTGIVRIHVPFFQTPANLLSYQFERTPFLNKIHRGLQEELSESAPDHVRELAEARVSMSNLVFGSMFTYAMAGNITGPPPTDAKLRANMEAAMGGKHWNSVHIAGEWRQYNKFDPVGGLFLTAAILASLGKNSFRVSTETDAADVGDEKFDKFVEVLLSGVEGLSTIITDRHYFKTISDTLHTLTGGSETQVKDLLAKTAGGYNPAASFYSSARRNILMKGNNPRKTIKDSRQEVNSLSDVWREITDVATAAYDKVTPGRGSNVVDINMVGEPKLWPGLTYQSEMGLLERLTNLTSSYTNILPGITPSKSILMQKIAQLEMTVKQPSDVKRIAGVLLNNEEREFFMAEFTKLNKLADIKRHGIVANSWFNELPEGIQRDMITTFLSDNESAAKRLTSVSFKRLIDHETIRARQEQQSLTAPVVPKGFQAPGQQQYLQSLLGQQ